MLVLSRKASETLVIGDGIVVTVKRIAGHRVTLGIEAPPKVRVLRGELATTRAACPATSPAVSLPR